MLKKTKWASQKCVLRLFKCQNLNKTKEKLTKMKMTTQTKAHYHHHQQEQKLSRPFNPWQRELSVIWTPRWRGRLSPCLNSLGNVTQSFFFFFLNHFMYDIESPRKRWKNRFGEKWIWVGGLVNVEPVIMKVSCIFILFSCIEVFFSIKLSSILLY